MAASSSEKQAADDVSSNCTSTLDDFEHVLAPPEDCLRDAATRPTANPLEVTAEERRRKQRDSPGHRSISYTLEPRMHVRVRNLLRRPELNGSVGRLIAYDDNKECWKLFLEDGSKLLLYAANLAPIKEEFEPGAPVTIVDVVFAPSLNGQHCTISHWDEEEGRWKVDMDDGRKLAYKPCNVVARSDTVIERNAFASNGHPQQVPLVATPPALPLLRLQKQPQHHQQQEAEAAQRKKEEAERLQREIEEAGERARHEKEKAARQRDKEEAFRMLSLQTLEAEAAQRKKEEAERLQREIDEAGERARHEKKKAERRRDTEDVHPRAAATAALPLPQRLQKQPQHQQDQQEAEFAQRKEEAECLQKGSVEAGACVRHEKEEADRQREMEEPALPAYKVLQQWLAQGEAVLPLATVTPNELVVENSIITAIREDEKRAWLHQVGRDLQDVDDDTLSKFRDKFWVLALKEAYRTGTLEYKQVMSPTQAINRIEDIRMRVNASSSSAGEAERGTLQQLQDVRADTDFTEPILTAGARVELCGLEIRRDINGRRGTLKETATVEGLWKVVMDDGSRKLLKPNHLRVLTCRAPQGTEISIGSLVQIMGLQMVPALNGMLGVVEGWSADESRWKVATMDGEGKQVKPCNLQPVCEQQSGGAESYPNDLSAGRVVRVCGPCVDPAFRGLIGKLDGWIEADDQWCVELSTGGRVIFDSAMLDPVPAVPETTSENIMQAGQRDHGPSNSREELGRGEQQGHRASGHQSQRLTRGCRVRTCDLIVSPNLNGLVGTVSGWWDEVQRWAVDMEDGSRMSFKEVNLINESGLVPGAHVCIHGLQTNAVFNGHAGVLAEWDSQMSSWRVHLQNGDSVLIRPENLTCSVIDGASAFSSNTACTPDPSSFSETASDRGRDVQAALELGCESSHTFEITPGMQVFIAGMQNRTDLNGKECVAVEFDRNQERWKVRTIDDEGLLVRSANLIPGYHFTGETPVAPGRRVQLRGLVNNVELNGKSGVAIRFDTYGRRWQVLMDDSSRNLLEVSKLLVTSSRGCDTSRYDTTETGFGVR